MAVAVGAQHARWPTGSGPSSGPSSPEQASLDRYREAVTPIRTLAGDRRVDRDRPLRRRLGVRAVAQLPAVAHRQRLRPDRPLLQHATSASTSSSLPWLHYLVDFVMAMRRGRADRGRGRALPLRRHPAAVAPASGSPAPPQAQLSVLLGLFVLAKAADYWLDRFDLLTDVRHLITGMTYTDDKAVLPARTSCWASR